MRVTLEQLLSYVSVSRDKLRLIYSRSIRIALLLSVSYISASTLSAFIMDEMLDSVLSKKRSRFPRSATVASVGSSKRINYHEMRKGILERNLFNSAGEVPEEATPTGGRRVQSTTSSFDINAPCKKTSIRVELLGTIYMGTGESVATIQESGYSSADVYQQGDAIIGNEQAVIARIGRSDVIINNGGTKECLFLAKDDKSKKKSSGFDKAGNGFGGPTEPPPPAPTGESSVSLEEKYVQDQLGPGFGAIIQKARLVPNTVDNKVNGFKIFAIDKASLLGKIGLKNGDIITQVNDISLKQPEQGFALYQAFQDEREVIINILRRGKTPKTINVRIK